MSTTPSPGEQRPHPSERWVRAYPSGDGPGWALEDDAIRAGWSVADEPESLAPWRADPWLAYKMDLAREQGVLTGDLNVLQQAVVVALSVLRHEADSARREADFLDMMFVTNQQMYQAYKKAKTQEALAEEIVWAAPSTPEELVRAAQELGDVLRSEGEWEVAYSEHDLAFDTVESPFADRDLEGMAD